MANSTGPPTAPSVLSLDERDYLERQVRRRRVGVEGPSTRKRTVAYWTPC
jgi:hypothetical protein